MHAKINTAQYLSFFLMGFTPCKAEQPLRGMKLQEKKHKKVKAYRKSIQKEPTCCSLRRARSHVHAQTHTQVS